MKNHDLSLALDNQTVKSLSIQSINWISLVYNHEHVEYSNVNFYSAIMNMLIISQHQLSLSSWACQLFSSISLLSHAQFSWLNFLWLKFSCSFLIIFLFDWSHSHVWDFNQIYYHKQLFCFVSCFSWEVSHLFLFSSCFVFLFEISVKLSAMSCYSILCSIFRKDLCLHFQISEMQISLAFVYNAWEWILWISLTEIW